MYNARYTLSDAERNEEKRNIRKIVNREGKDGDIDMETGRITAWRTEQWNELCKHDSFGQEEPTVDEIQSHGVSILFGNNAARSAYITYLK